MYRKLAVLIVLSATVAGCRSVYYQAWETLGREKRELLRANVEEVKDEQEKAVASFDSALEALRAVTGFDGGDLERTYNRLRRSYERSQARADDVTERIEKIAQIADDLFAEWEREIDEIDTASLRERSREQLQETRARYRDLETAMRRSADTMEPVLDKLQDQVLFLKHQLNARAVDSIEGEALELEAEVEGLIDQIRASIREAEQFIRQMPEE
jgi:ElaB/YqjD/DUF883 family membrane-anchored ribosome-binding protein